MKLKSPPKFINPQLAELVEQVPEGRNWLHEIKYDGYRTLCRIEHDNVKFLTRSGLDWTSRYEVLIDAAKKLKLQNAFFDGEVVCLDENGRSDFQMLQNALSEKRFDKIFYFVFDLLFLNGKDWCQKTLIERKKHLKKLLQHSKKNRFLFSEHFKQGDKMFKECCRLHLEGVVSKEANAPYVSGRSAIWQKIKCTHREEFIIGGYTLTNKAQPFSALLLGYFDENKKLHYAGRVGTGFSDTTFDKILQKIEKLSQKKSSFQVNSPKKSRDILWLKPKLIAEIEFKNWTSHKLIRQPIFCGLREDKKSTEIKIEVTHPDRLIYPQSQTTKKDVIDYHNKISPYMLPFLYRRPASIYRCQKTTLADCFYQKYSDGTNPLGVDNRKIQFGKKIDFAFDIKNKGDILRLIQAGTIEIHGWQATFTDISKPDQIVFDLDPDSPQLWSRVIDTAYEIREQLKCLDLESFVKVTGGKGVHIHVPIRPNYNWSLVKAFSKSFMQILIEKNPNHYTTHISKTERKGKIFLDYLRNDYGATAVIPYCLRARKKPSVALPITWKDLKHCPSADAFIYTDVLELVNKRNDPWKHYFKIKQRISILEKTQSK